MKFSFEAGFSADWLQNVITAEWVKTRINSGLHTYSSHVNLTTSKLSEFHKEVLSLNRGLVSVGDKEKTGFYISDDLLITFETKTWSIDVSVICGTKEMADEIASTLASKLNSSRSNVRWVYDDQYFETITVPLNNKHKPVQEMYPFLGGEPLTAYFERFIASDSNILILIGPPGTGKTTFLRGLLDHTQSTATVSYSAKVLSKDAFFVDWLESESNVLVMEDSDEMLTPRSEGNGMMHRFLNLGDGLVTIPGKKLIFTTNLPSTAEIDTALTRPGRCFDILHFSALRGDEIDAVCDVLGLSVPDKAEATLSELFEHNKQAHTKQQRRKVGFI